MRGISFVISYYHGKKFIFNCLDSIISSYNHSDKILDFEIIVVIDSMDDSDEISELLTKKYKGAAKILILKNKSNIGVAKSRNYGLSNIQFNFFTVIDQDDFLTLNYFHEVSKSLDDECAIHIINGVINYTEQEREIPIFFFSPKFDFESLLFQRTILYTPGLIIINKKHISIESLFIDTSSKFKGSDDWAAYLSILAKSEKASYKYINAKLFVYCIHGSNYSNNKQEMILSSLSVLENLLEQNLSEPKRNLVLLAKKRYEFLNAMKFQNYSIMKQIGEFPNQFVSHYFTSFFHTDRMNRLIFRVRKSLAFQK